MNCRARTGEEGGRTSRDGWQCRPCLVSHFFHSFAFPFPLCVGVPQNSVSSPVLSDLLLGRYHTAPCPDAVIFVGVTVRKHFEPRKGKADLPGLPHGRSHLESGSRGRVPSARLLSPEWGVCPGLSNALYFKAACFLLPRVPCRPVFSVPLAQAMAPFGLCPPFIPPARRSLLRLVYFVSLLLSAAASPAPPAHLSSPPSQSSGPPASSGLVSLCHRGFLA